MEQLSTDIEFWSIFTGRAVKGRHNALFTLLTSNHMHANAGDKKQVHVNLAPSQSSFGKLLTCSFAYEDRIALKQIVYLYVLTVLLNCVFINLQKDVTVMQVGGYERMDSCFGICKVMGGINTKS